MVRSQVVLTFSLLISILLMTSNCTVPQVNHIEIVPKLTISKQTIGEGVSMLIPLDYQKVEADNGYAASFETENLASSLSLQVVQETLSTVKSAYSPASLEENDLSLSELSTVQYGENPNAFFAKVHDDENAVFGYVLAIEQKDKTYLIEGASTDISHDFYDYKIRQALLSVFIE